jgi:hypothetical protein
MQRLLLFAFTLSTLLLAGGCGSSGNQSSTSSQAGTTTTTASGGSTTASSGPAALQAEANATAAGDIPDNQVFLVFRNGKAGYSMKYPEGWAQQGSSASVTFRDKNNIVRIMVAPGKAPSKVSVQADLARLKGVSQQSPPQAMTISDQPAFKVVYRTVSAANAVTGKRVTLVVDRYYLWKSGHRAVVDLGTPRGVDNVDAYRLMIESFRWS